MTTPEMKPQKTGIIGRIVQFFLSVLVPLILIIAVTWSVWRLVTALVGQWEVYNRLDQRVSAYRETATAIAPTVAAVTDDFHNLSYARRLQSGRSEQPQGYAQVFVTNTPLATDAPIASATPPPSGTIVLPTPLFPEDPRPDLVDVTAIPTRVPLVPRDYNLVNIILLGGDDELVTDGSFRTDTMIVVSINLDTGTVAMLSLPRDIFVYIPSGTMQRLNTAFAIGEQIGWTGGGFGLLRQTLLYNFGINVHYYARVNFSGFEQIIDTLGGVDVAVDCAYEDYYPVEDFDISRPIEENYTLRVLPVGYYTLNGFDALWYARTRRVADDFDRGRRQQQILRAIFRKALDSGQIANLPTLWGQLTSIVETDLTLQDILPLIPIGLNLDVGEIENYTFIRTYHTTPWQTPSGDFVQLPNYEPIADLMFDFYHPPTSSRIALSGRTIAIYNGTDNPNWDIIAAERLRWEGINAIAMGTAEEKVADTRLIDLTGEDKGSPVPSIQRFLNIRPDQVEVQPNPNRQYDYVVVIGANYNSCTYGVVPVGGS